MLWSGAAARRGFELASEELNAFQWPLDEYSPLKSLNLSSEGVK
jgi:hypothetical protein